MHSVTLDPTERFSKTVENYLKYRPGYPNQVIKFLSSEYGFSPDSMVADIGSGTGILTKMLLENGNFVFAIEPNSEMRIAGENFLSASDKFKSVDAQAENTGLEDNSVDFIIAAQSFHWFHKKKARAEFKRILKDDGYVILLWNMRDNEASVTMREYESMLNKFGIDYRNVAAENIKNSDISDFFSPNGFHLKTFPNKQVLDWDGFLGRILSTSYVPKEGQKDYDSMIKRAELIFEENHKGDIIEMFYKTKCYVGQL